MNRMTTLLSSVMFCAAPFATVQAGTDGAFALTPAQMDAVTAGQASSLTAIATAYADAVGRLAQTRINTATAAWVNESPGQPTATLGATVTTAEGFAVGTGSSGQSQVFTSTVNEQPLPDHSVVGTTIQWNINIGGVTMGVDSQVKVGGHPLYWFNQAFAPYGGSPLQ